MSPLFQHPRPPFGHSSVEPFLAHRTVARILMVRDTEAMVHLVLGSVAVAPSQMAGWSFIRWIQNPKIERLGVQVAAIRVKRLYYVVPGLQRQRKQ